LLPAGRPLTHPGRRLEGRRRPLRGAVRTIACTLRPGTRQHGIFFGDWLDGEELSGTKRQGDSTQHRLFRAVPTNVSTTISVYRQSGAATIFATLTNDMRKQVAQRC
jgi:hypothetical protein